MSDLPTGETKRTAVPFTILPNRQAEPGRLLVFAIVAMAVLVFLAAATGMFGAADAGPPWPVRAFFIAVGAAILFVAGLGLREALGRHALQLGVSRDHLMLGKRRIPWQQVAEPSIEVTETEQGGYLAHKIYHVTFCIVGDRTFGTWPRIDPRRYVDVRGMSDAHRAEVLCGFLRQVRVSALSGRLGDLVAVPSGLNVVASR
jgi:hypothetical protein